MFTQIITIATPTKTNRFISESYNTPDTPAHPPIRATLLFRQNQFAFVRNSNIATMSLYSTLRTKSNGEASICSSTRSLLRLTRVQALLPWLVAIARFGECRRRINQFPDSARASDQRGAKRDQGYDHHEDEAFDDVSDLSMSENPPSSRMFRGGEGMRE